MVGDAVLREPRLASEAPVNREFELSIKVFFNSKQGIFRQNFVTRI